MTTQNIGMFFSQVLESLQEVSPIPSEEQRADIIKQITSLSLLMKKVSFVDILFLFSVVVNTPSDLWANCFSWTSLLASHSDIFKKNKHIIVMFDVVASMPQQMLRIPAEQKTTVIKHFLDIVRKKNITDDMIIGSIFVMVLQAFYDKNLEQMIPDLITPICDYLLKIPKKDRESVENFSNLQVNY